MKIRLVFCYMLISFLAVNANAKGNGDYGVVILSCGKVNDGGMIPKVGINIASFSSSISQLPESVAMGEPCAQAIVDLNDLGFKVTNILPVGAGGSIVGQVIGTPEITYNLVRDKK